jgi:diguanylate cyclase
LAGKEIIRARRTGEPIAIIIADIDHFKSINDQHGHDAGDRVIVHASALLAQLCRAGDVVTRWGGEEFLVLLPMTTTQHAAELAERFRDAMQATQVLSPQQQVLRFTLSFGVASLTLSEPLETSIAQADKALYQSKQAGRNQVSVAF